MPIWLILSTVVRFWLKGSAKELKEAYSKPYLLVDATDASAFSDVAYQLLEMAN